MREQEQKYDIDEDIIDCMIERPHAFMVDEDTFYIYPVSLGVSMLSARLIRAMSIDFSMMQKKPSLEALRICAKSRHLAVDLIALRTFKGKEEVFDAQLRKARKERIEELPDTDLAQLLLICLAETSVTAFSKHLGIEEERKQMERVVKISQKGDSSISFGGRSLYGALLDAAMERYGWTYEYTMWGVSYVNLKLLMQDRLQTIYLTKEQRKKLHIPKDRSKLNADDPHNFKKISQLLKDN